MDISEKSQAGNPEQHSQPERREASTPPRHSDWISYATAVTKQPQTTSPATT